MLDYYCNGKEPERADDECPRTGVARACATAPCVGLLSMLGDWDSPARHRPGDASGATSACPMDRPHRPCDNMEAPR